MARNKGGFFGRIKSLASNIFGRTEETKIPTPAPTHTVTHVSEPKIKADSYIEKTERVSFDDIPVAPRPSRTRQRTETVRIPEIKQRETIKTRNTVQRSIRSYEDYLASREAAKQKVLQTEIVKQAYDAAQSVKRERTYSDIELLNSEITTTEQMNLASSRKTEGASIYTQDEVKVFYRAFQNVWQGENVELEDRNTAILDYVNEQREDYGLEPISLGDLMGKTVEANRLALMGQELDTRYIDDEVAFEAYDRIANSDHDDNSKTSPTDASVMNQIQEALSQLIFEPNYLD